MQQGSLQVGPELRNISGRIRLTGGARDARYASRGELALDSLTYKNFQFTEIIGPLWFDNNRVVLGDWGPQSRSVGQPNRHVTARLLDGLVAGDCQVELAQRRAIISARPCPKATWGNSRENLVGHQKLNGKVLANIDVVGDRDPHLFGSGSLHLTEADVYTLPVMVSLLKIARAKTPDATAFTQSDISFDVRGKHVVLKQISLDGDAISLSGKGELTLDGQTNRINMQLHTKVVRTATVRC